MMKQNCTHIPDIKHLFSVTHTQRKGKPLQVSSDVSSCKDNTSLCLSSSTTPLISLSPPPQTLNRPMHSPVTYSPPCHSLSIHLSTPSLFPSPPKVYPFHHSPPCLTSIPFSNPSLCIQLLKSFFSSPTSLPSISPSIPNFYRFFISYCMALPRVKFLSNPRQMHSRVQ